MTALGAPVCAQTAASSVSDAARQVVREIAEVKGGTTPAEWLHGHADEKLQMFSGAQYANDTYRWCARTVVTHTGTGHAWIRYAYFYDPQPPADDALPVPGTSSREVLETSCQLGLVWIDIPEDNPAVGNKTHGGDSGGARVTPRRRFDTTLWSQRIRSGRMDG